MHKAKLIAAAVGTVFLIIIFIQNRESVETKLLFASITMPRALLLLLTAAVGYLLGLISAMMWSGREKKAAAE